MKIDYCLHTHTARCGHAQGKDEEYVINAIKAGIKVLGFTDHVFLPGISQRGTRGDFSELDDYVNSVLSLKEKYKDQIQILLGFECEYFDEYVDYYKELKAKGFDYFILGQHFFLNSDGLFYVRNSLEDENRERYIREIEKGIKTGLFTYFAHPDLILTTFHEWCDAAEEISYRICKICKENDIPIEINLNGMIWNLPVNLIYPCEQFWEIAGKIGNKVVIGYDAHNPGYFLETKYLERALSYVEKYNLNLLNKEEILKYLK